MLGVNSFDVCNRYMMTASHGIELVVCSRYSRNANLDILHTGKNNMRDAAENCTMDLEDIAKKPVKDFEMYLRRDRFRCATVMMRSALSCVRSRLHVYSNTSHINMVRETCVPGTHLCTGR